MDDISCPVTERAFDAMRVMDIEAISELSDAELRPLLPCLVRMALCVPIDVSEEWLSCKKRILLRLSANEKANSIVSLLSIDFHVLDSEVKKELVARSRGAGQQPVAGELGLAGVIPDNLIVEFERGSALSKFRVVLSEYLATQAHAIGLTNQPNVSSTRRSELLDNEVYVNEVCDVLVIAIVELPTSISLLDVSETLIHTRRGPELICRLVANFADCFQEVSSVLLANAEKQDEDLIVSRSRIRALRMLCKMCPDKALIVRSLAVDMCRLPGLTVLISIDYQRAKAKDENNELVTFVSSILLGGDEKVRLWFSQYLRVGQKRLEQNQSTSVIAMRRELLRCLKLLHERLSTPESATDSEIIEATSLLRLYCALRSMPGMNMKFNEEESAAILNVVTSEPPVTPSGVKSVSLFLCVLIACPSLVACPDADKRIVNWLQKLIQEETYFGHDCQVKSSCEEMLLLIAIHFHSSQIGAISDLVCSFIGVKLQIRAANLARLRTIFTQEIFPEEKIAAHAVKVPVTAGLNANISGYVPAHCVFQLLKSRTFNKYKVPIREWIFKQICCSAPPIHPILPSMIEAFVSSVVIAGSRSLIPTPSSEPIVESDILSVFRQHVFKFNRKASEKHSSESSCDQPVTHQLTTQLLLLYYVLLHRDMWLTQCKQQLSVKGNPYNEILSHLPVFHLIQEARRDQNNFGVLFPPLLRLAATHLSHLCLVPDWLNTSALDDHEATTVIARNKGTSVAIENLIAAMNQLPGSAPELISLLDRLLASPHQSLWPLAPAFVDSFPNLLKKNVPKSVREKCKKIWWRMNSIFPDSLWVMTVNALRSESSRNAVRGQLSWLEVVRDPLYVLRCEERVFRCPELTEITLHMLDAFLAASRNMLSAHLMEKASKNPEEEKDREELKLALIASQECAAIQILLELCLPFPDETETGLLQPLREVQGLICTHLHQVFITDPNLAKLVHFQTYASELLSLTVTAIPSMHICLDFIPELLSQPDLATCIFAIELCSYLSLQYSTTKCLCVAKLCFNVSSTLLSLLSSDKRSSFFKPVLPALVRMCTAFPPLRDDALLLLKQLSHVSLSKLSASSCTFVSPASLSRAYSLAKLKYPDTQSFLSFCSSLPDDEALFLILKESQDCLEKEQPAQKL